MWALLGSQWVFLGWYNQEGQQASPEPQAVADRIAKGLAGQFASRVLVRNQGGVSAEAQGWTCPEPTMGLSGPQKIQWLGQDEKKIEPAGIVAGTVIGGGLGAAFGYAADKTLLGTALGAVAGAALFNYVASP